MAGRRRGRSRSKRPRLDSDDVPHGSSSSLPPPDPVRIHPPVLPTPWQIPGSTQNATKDPPPAGTTGGAPRFGSESLGAGSQIPRGKVAIPTLRTAPSRPISERSTKERTSHACEVCRKAKVGCSGGQTCQRCGNLGLPCVYGDKKRDRDRKRLSRLGREVGALSQHNFDVAHALDQARSDNSLSMDELRLAIDDILAMAPVSASDVESGPASRQMSIEADKGASGGESDVTSFGSTGSLDVVHVDTDRHDIRSTGHLGKASSVAWTKRVAEESQRSGAPPTRIGTTDRGLTLASYHSEEGDFENVDTTNTDPYEWPHPSVADALVERYFTYVHGSLPLVDKFEFLERYNNFLRGSTALSVAEVTWLGTLNAIFAVSSLHLNLSKPFDGGHQEDHIVFCARAEMLCMNLVALYQDASIPSTRALGLICLCYISNARINRAWMVCGLAIRQAITLGLHLRSGAQDLTDCAKEQRIRLWWSLYSLECSLNELTGRPSCISDLDISIPLLLNVDEHQLVPGLQLSKTGSAMDARLNASDSIQVSRGKQLQTPRSSFKSSMIRPTATYQMPSSSANPRFDSFPIVEPPLSSSSYFIYRTQLTIISHEVITELYCAATSQEKWLEVQETIRRIDRRLRNWRNSLPDRLDMELDTQSPPDWDSPLTAPRIGLAMMFKNSQMMLFRPCLCRFEGRMSNQSQMSREFNEFAAKACVRAAGEMVQLIRWSSPTTERLYTISSWWSTLHYLCKALSVFMLELALRAQHLPYEAGDIVQAAKEGILLLRTMSAQTISARKAWEVFDSLLNVVTPLVGGFTNDMPTDAPIPPRYVFRRYSGAAAALPQEQTEDLTAKNIAHSVALPQTTEAGSQRSDPIAAWHDQQHLDPMVRTHEFEGDTGGLDVHGYDDYMISRPLDHTAALQNFSLMGNVHCQYDEPWQFRVSSLLGPMELGALGQMGNDAGQLSSSGGQRTALEPSSLVRSGSEGRHASVLDFGSGSMMDSSRMTGFGSEVPPSFPQASSHHVNVSSSKGKKPQKRNPG